MAIKLRAARDELAMLKRENDSLRSLAQGGGQVSVPRELVERAEKEFGLRFLSNPVVHRIASEELRDRIAAALESRFGPSGIDDRQEAYRQIGWLGNDDELLPQLTAIRAVGARGWFDEATGEAWVTDRFDVKNIPDQAALVRLLARVLLHQLFCLHRLIPAMMRRERGKPCTRVPHPAPRRGITRQMPARSVSCR